MYGKLVSTDGKEDNMKDYIVIHVDNEPVIIFKKHIVAIQKDKGGAYIQHTSGDYFTTDKYSDIVKQML
jgi:hypothetical protein